MESCSSAACCHSSHCKGGISGKVCMCLLLHVLWMCVLGTLMWCAVCMALNPESKTGTCGIGTSTNKGSSNSKSRRTLMPLRGGVRMNSGCGMVHPAPTRGWYAVVWMVLISAWCVMGEHASRAYHTHGRLCNADVRRRCDFDLLGVLFCGVWLLASFIWCSPTPGTTDAARTLLKALPTATVRTHSSSSAPHRPPGDNCCW